MIAWTYVNPTTVTGPGRRPYARTAHHIRGRVYVLRPGTRKTRTLWGMEVVNTHTGKVLASDDCTGHSKVVALCDETTAAARAAWFWDFRKRELQ